MGWLKKKFRQVKKKIKKILSTPWGRVLGMIGMYFAMGAATKAFSGWWNSLPQAGAEVATQVGKVAEIAETAESGIITTKEAFSQSLKEGALGAKDRTAFLNNLNTSAGNLQTNLLTGSNQAAANSAFSAFDTNSIGNYFSGNTEALNLSNSITDTVSQNLAQLKNPQTINVQDFLVENLDVQAGFPELGITDMTAAEYQALGGQGPLLAETGTGPSSVSYTGTLEDIEALHAQGRIEAGSPISPPSSFLSPEELRQQAITGEGVFAEGVVDPSRIGARDLTALSPPSYTPVTFGQRLGEFGKETWEGFTDPAEYKKFVKELPVDIAKLGISTKVMGAIMGDDEEEQPIGGYGAPSTALEAPISDYVQDLSPNMLRTAGVNINITDPYKTAAQLLTQNYTGTANPYFMNQVIQPILPFPYRPYQVT